MEDSSQHNKSKEDKGAGTGKEKHGKETSEQHSSHGKGNKHCHGHREEQQHVGGWEGPEPVEYIDMGGMTAAAFLEIRYRAVTGKPYDEVEQSISLEKIAKQPQQQSQEEAAGREGVVYEF